MPVGFVVRPPGVGRGRFWLLGGLLVLIGLLLWTPGSLLTLLFLAVGAGVGSLPFLRGHLQGCRRLTTPANREHEPR